MGIRIKDANEQQKLFLAEIADDPAKGKPYLNVLESGLDVMAGIRDVLKAGAPEELIVILRSLGAKIMVAAVMSNYEDKEVGSAKAAAIRLDIVKYLKLAGDVLKEDTGEWDEAAKTITRKPVGPGMNPAAATGYGPDDQDFEIGPGSSINGQMQDYNNAATDDNKRLDQPYDDDHTAESRK